MTPVANTPNMFGKDEKWSGIKFSNNGCDMLITTRQEKIYVLDSFTYTLKHTLSGFQNKTQLNIEASFSPDGKYIFGGSQDGIVHAWEVASGKKVKEFTGHPAAVSCVAFNPRYLMMASACVNLAFWIPSMDWAAGNRLF
jgi:COMPASS component SWD2